MRIMEHKEKPILIFLHLFSFERHRETEHKWGEGQREKDTENPKQAPGSELTAQSLTRDSNSQTMRS